MSRNVQFENDCCDEDPQKQNLTGHLFYDICRSEMNSAKSILPNFPVERFFCLH